MWNETWLAAFFHKPCNHELFVRQSLNMEGAAAPAPAPAFHILARPDATPRHATPRHATPRHATPRGFNQMHACHRARPCCDLRRPAGCTA